MLIGILSDAHGHGRALASGLAILHEQGVELSFFLGDSVGYVPSASAVQILMENQEKIRCVRGNHEAMLLDGNFKSSKERLYRLEETMALLSPSELSFIRSWPSSRVEKIDGLTMLFIHGTPTNYLCGYMYPDEDVPTTNGKFQAIFQGNTHWPMEKSEGKTVVVNPGSCSMPRDHGNLGSVATFDTLTGKVRVLRYSITEENNALLYEFPDLGEEIVQIFSRTLDQFVGELVT